jgi:hypothetical protein
MMMDSPFSTPDAHLAAIAARAVEYLSELFHRAVLEAEKSHPANFHVDDSGHLH